MQRMVAGATGLIGTQLVNQWLEQGHLVTVIGRSKTKMLTLFNNRVRALEWQELKAEDLHSAEIVVNLTGAGIAEKRWSASRKKEILASRITATEKLVKLLISLAHNAPMLFNASAIGIYGLQQQIPNALTTRLDENTDIDWNNPPDFLSSIARQCEKATFAAAEAGVRVVNLRFGVVLAKKGGALPKIMLPYYFCIGGVIGKGQQPFSWITLDDVILAINFLLKNKNFSGPVNIVSPGCVTQRQLSRAIGRVLHRPSFMVTPAFMLKCMLGEMAQELLLEGQHVYPSKLLELGFQFSYPDIDSALKHIQGT